MPIHVESQIYVYGQEEFHAIDWRIMRIVFDVHNEFGRFLDETLFKREIAARCVSLGIRPAQLEVRIRVVHESFIKDYFMDMLVAGGVLIEAKTVEQLTPAHRNQALNYLLLAGLHHGRLLNLRTERVQFEFVSTRLTHELRRQFSV